MIKIKNGIIDILSSSGLSGESFGSLLKRLNENFKEFNFDESVKPKILEILISLKKNKEINTYRVIEKKVSSKNYSNDGYLKYTQTEEVNTEEQIRKYINEVFFVGKKETRRNFLDLKGLELSDIQYCVLEQIGKNREKGKINFLYKR
jgi:hypothetical protein